jgi:hypothetical protein
MKQIKVLIDRDDGWEILYEGPQRIRVELDPADQEGSQIEGMLFDANAPEPEPEPWLEEGV